MEIAKDYILFILSLIVEKFSAGMGLIFFQQKNIFTLEKMLKHPLVKSTNF